MVYQCFVCAALSAEVPVSMMHSAESSLGGSGPEVHQCEPNSLQVASCKGDIYNTAVHR
jgi:hypothetical protein